MNNIVASCLFAASIVFFAWYSPTIAAADQHQLDILYMNHGPMRPTIAKLKELLSDYPDLGITWYDVDTDSGKQFMNEHKLTGHIPLLIRLDGQSRFQVDGKTVNLQGFPTGAAPFKRVEGDWSIADLQHILENVKE